MDRQENAGQWLWSFLFFWLFFTTFGIWTLWWFFPMLWWIIAFSVWADPMREPQAKARKAKVRQAWNDNRRQDYYIDDYDIERYERLIQPEPRYQTLRTHDGETLRVIEDDGKMPPRLHIG